MQSSISWMLELFAKLSELLGGTLSVFGSQVSFAVCLQGVFWQPVFLRFLLWFEACFSFSPFVFIYLRP